MCRNTIFTKTKFREATLMWATDTLITSTTFCHILSPLPHLAKLASPRWHYSLRKRFMWDGGWLSNLVFFISWQHLQQIWLFENQILTLVFSLYQELETSNLEIRCIFFILISLNMKLQILKLGVFLSDPGVPGVRSMGPVVSHKLSEWGTLLQTKLMWLWVMKIWTQY